MTKRGGGPINGAMAVGLLPKGPAPAPAKRGPGRPKMPPSEARTLRLPLRLSATERAALVDAAGGRELTTWARETLLTVAGMTRGGR